MIERSPHRDDDLVKLGLQLGEAWAAQSRLHELLRDDDSDEADVACDASYERVNALIDRIDAEPADTFLGACMKALAVCWCEMHVLPDDPDKADYPDRGDRLVAAARRALLAVQFGPGPEASP